MRLLKRSEDDDENGIKFSGRELILAIAPALMLVALMLLEVSVATWYFIM